MRYTSKVAIFALAGLENAAERNADVCRALVLSGGGTNGAWDAGILWGLVNNGNPTDFAYDVTTGVSTGAINTASIAGFAPEEAVKNAPRWIIVIDS